MKENGVTFGDILNKSHPNRPTIKSAVAISTLQQRDVVYRILIAAFLSPRARVRFCFRSFYAGHHRRINGGLLVTATLRLLCADKLRETRLRRTRQSVRDEGEKSRIRISVCLSVEA